MKAAIARPGFYYYDSRVCGLGPKERL